MTDISANNNNEDISSYSLKIFPQSIYEDMSSLVLKIFPQYKLHHKTPTPETYTLHINNHTLLQFFLKPSPTITPFSSSS